MPTRFQPATASSGTRSISTGTASGRSKNSARRGKIAFFLTFGVVLASVAVAVGFGWIILNWRQELRVFLGIIFFGAIAAGLILNTSFLVREIRRNEQHDSFINAVTHELKTPIASIRLYLETLQSRAVDEAQRREFYGIMQEDTERLISTVDQVLRAGEAGHKLGDSHRMPLARGVWGQDWGEGARPRHHLSAEAVQFHSAANYTVMANAEELRAAISNVLDNAIKFSGGKDKVQVKVTVAEANNAS